MTSSPDANSEINIIRDLKLDTSDRHSREELPWFNEQEQMLTNWMSTCAKKTKEHYKVAKYNALLYNITAIFSVIFPILANVFIAIWPERFVISIIMVSLTGLTNGVIGVFSFNTVRDSHELFSGKYESLQREIMNILIVPRKFRQACDVTIKYFEMKLNHYNETAPEL
jgi:hypothetical protein